MPRYLLYADDTNILYENFDTKTIIKTINMEMPKISGLSTINYTKTLIKLLLYYSTLVKNVNKTVTILFLVKNVNKTVTILFHTIQKR